MEPDLAVLLVDVASPEAQELSWTSDHRIEAKQKDKLLVSLEVWDKLVELALGDVDESALALLASIDIDRDVFGLDASLPADSQVPVPERAEDRRIRADRAKRASILLRYRSVSHLREEFCNLVGRHLPKVGDAYILKLAHHPVDPRPDGIEPHHGPRTLSAAGRDIGSDLHVGDVS